MQVERKWHVLLTIFFLVITSGQCMDSKEVRQKERRTLLDLILQVIKDSQQRDKPMSRRCGSGPHTSAQDMKFSSREKPFYVPRLDNRLIENTRIAPYWYNVVPRDPNMKGKFIQHFGGQVKFSPECKTHFHRLYHNTRDCSTPAYYKRCARLLTRLAMSPLCMQS
ncbi:ALK and LTK ligand 1 isoform 2-T2 [Xenentodon cancila]